MTLVERSNRRATSATTPPGENASVRMASRSAALHLRRRSGPVRTVTWPMLCEATTALNENYVLTLYSRPTPIQARAFELLGANPDRTQ
jgi:hypothetical protein